MDPCSISALKFTIHRTRMDDRRKIRKEFKKAWLAGMIRNFESDFKFLSYQATRVVTRRRQGGNWTHYFSYLLPSLLLWSSSFYGMETISQEDASILDKLDSVVPAPLAQFDAFPKLPSTYKARSESRGFMTVFVCILAFLLMLNDIGEFIWGWPDYEFSVDKDTSSFMNINVDLVVKMPCRCNGSLRPRIPSWNSYSYFRYQCWSQRCNRGPSISEWKRFEAGRGTFYVTFTVILSSWATRLDSFWHWSGYQAQVCRLPFL